MSLYLATILTGIGSIFLGILVFQGRRKPEENLAFLSRSRPLAAILGGLALTWFLFHITQLGESDFGQYRNLFLIAFLAVGVLSWIFLPDLLGLRAIGVLGILVGHQLLNAAWMEDPLSRLFLVVFAYTLIVAGMLIGVSPYRLRDMLGWTWKKDQRVLGISGVLVAYGILLMFSAFIFY